MRTMSIRSKLIYAKRPLMKITDVFFDLDDTLCDFSGARDRGLAAAFAMLPVAHRLDALAIWNDREPDLFRSFATKQLGRDQYRFARFDMVLPLGLYEDRDTMVARMNDLFMAEVNDRVGLMPGALECLAAIRSLSIRCHLLTNGPTDGQRRKIARLGLEDVLDYIQIGEEVGVFKPDARAYELALDRIGRSASSVVMVGDSLVDDIFAADAVGLRTIYFSRKGVSDLADIPSALEGLDRDRDS